MRDKVSGRSHIRSVYPQARIAFTRQPAVRESDTLLYGILTRRGVREAAPYGPMGRIMSCLFGKGISASINES